jgi:hypothetical protein
MIVLLNKSRLGQIDLYQVDIHKCIDSDPLLELEVYGMRVMFWKLCKEHGVKHFRSTWAGLKIL